MATVWRTVEAIRNDRRILTTVPAADVGMVAAAAGANGWSTLIREATDSEIAAAERREP